MKAIIQTKHGFVTIFDRLQWKENSFDVWLNKAGRRNGKTEVYCGKVSVIEINAIEKLVKQAKDFCYA